MKARGERERAAGASFCASSLAVVLGAGTVVVALHDWLGLGPLLARLRGRRARLRRGDRRRRADLPSALAERRDASAAPGSRSARDPRPGAPPRSTGRRRSSNDPSPPYPSPADIGYLAFYPLADARPRPAGPRPRRRARTGGSGWTARSPPSARRRSAPPSSSTSSPARPKAPRCRSRRPSPTRSGDIALLSLVRRRHRPDPLAPGPDLVAAARRPRRAGGRRHRLHPAVDRPGAPGRRLDRPDLPDRRAPASAPGVWQRRARARSARPARIDGWRELIVPGVFAAVMIGLFAMQYFERQPAASRPCSGRRR